VLWRRSTWLGRRYVAQFAKSSYVGQGSEFGKQIQILSQFREHVITAWKTQVRCKSHIPGKCWWIPFCDLVSWPSKWQFSAEICCRKIIFHQCFIYFIPKVLYFHRSESTSILRYEQRTFWKHYLRWLALPLAISIDIKLRNLCDQKGILCNKSENSFYNNTLK